MITSDGKCITEIKKRIATAKDAFQKLSLILPRNISMTTKFRVLKTYVWSTLTYGCECWTRDIACFQTKAIFINTTRKKQDARSTNKIQDCLIGTLELELDGEKL